LKIQIMTRQYRRDFSADLVCEHCGGEQHLDTGYDDRNFHDNIIPKIKCKRCGKSREDLGITAEPTPTKYPEGQQV